MESPLNYRFTEKEEEAFKKKFKQLIIQQHRTATKSTWKPFKKIGADILDAYPYHFLETKLLNAIQFLTHGLVRVKKRTEHHKELGVQFSTLIDMLTLIKDKFHKLFHEQIIKERQLYRIESYSPIHV